ncbi:TMEM175 family protein [Streptomyces xiaopingdaonensis]|uniref:TMEM175 family protein n=1 Tax=Streptomyces xiaopingdaonensis TaxID=1565415 RepID=UPI00031D624D|nr:TMEM175 family protein [Streptomyces xiaopingdaonensis]
MPAQRRRPEKYARSDTDRAETFSDGVFAIAVTLLVLDLRDPRHRRGGEALLEQWPAYLGYLASFGFVAVIWLNHHQAFVRIRAMDRGAQAANLGLLLTTASLAFPTGVVSDALREDPAGVDARTASVVYAAVAALMCLAWTIFYAYLGSHPELLDDAVEPLYVRHGVVRSVVGVLAYSAAGAAGALMAPMVALAAFVVLPVFYFVTSEGTLLPRRRARART